MNRMDRLLGVLTLLQSKKYVPAEKIADKYHISIRTVYRDIKALTALNIPIGFEHQKGYFIMQGYFLPPVAFSTEEANALVLSELLVYGFADKSTQKHYATALNKVKAVLRSSQKQTLDDLDGSLRIQMHPKLLLNVDYLSQIQHAITSQLIIELEYKDKKEATSIRQIEPIGLIYYAFSWHIMGWCNLRKAYRDFKVNRITKLKITSNPFKKENHITVNEFMKNLPVDY